MQAGAEPVCVKSILNRACDGFTFIHVFWCCIRFSRVPFFMHILAAVLPAMLASLRTMFRITDEWLLSWLWHILWHAW